MDEPDVLYDEQRAANGASPAPMVERAFRLLDLLASADDRYSLSELGRLLGMSKSSIHGLLKTLESAGAVVLDDERRYTLGPRIYELAQAYVRRGGLRRIALPALWRLAARTGETALLGIVEPGGVRIVERAETANEQVALRVSARPGMRVHLLAGATGRVVLASWPLAARAEYLRSHPLPHFTGRSLTEPDAYLAAVAETARTGIGTDREEYLAGVNAVAAPLRGPGSGLAGVLWIVGVSARFDGDALARAAVALRDEASGISRSLGDNGSP